MDPSLFAASPVVDTLAVLPPADFLAVSSSDVSLAVSLVVSCVAVTAASTIDVFPIAVSSTDVSLVAAISTEFTPLNDANSLVAPSCLLASQFLV